jgi:hypothetical protein
MANVTILGYVEMNVVIRFVDEKWSEELTSNATDPFFVLAGEIKRNVSEDKGLFNGSLHALL